MSRKVDKNKTNKTPQEQKTILDTDLLPLDNVAVGTRLFTGCW